MKSEIELTTQPKINPDLNEPDPAPVSKGCPGPPAPGCGRRGSCVPSPWRLGRLGRISLRQQFSYSVSHVALIRPLPPSLSTLNTRSLFYEGHRDFQLCLSFKFQQILTHLVPYQPIGVLYWGEFWTVRHLLYWPQLHWYFPCNDIIPLSLNFGKFG